MQLVNEFSFCSLWRKKAATQNHLLSLEAHGDVVQGEVKTEAGEKKLRTSTCIAAAYCIFVQTHLTAASLGSG